MAVGVRELVEWEAGEFADDIIDGGLEARVARFRDRVEDLIERQSNREFRGNFGDRIACRFGGEG